MACAEGTRKKRNFNWSRDHFDKDGWCKHPGCPKGKPPNYDPDAPNAPQPMNMSNSSNTNRLVLEAIADIWEKFQCHIVAIVADNAANMQGITNAENADTVGDERLLADLDLPLLVRCACHVLQLAVKDIKSLWEPVLEEALAYAEEHDVKVSPNKTRWNSSYLAIMAVKKHMYDTKWAEGDAQRSVSIGKFEEVCALLAPFAYATRLVEGDAATLWSCLCAVQSLHEHFASSNLAGSAKALVMSVLDKRLQMLYRSPAYTLMAFCSPQAFAESDDVDTSLGLELLDEGVIARMLRTVPTMVPEAEVERLGSLATPDPSTAAVGREQFDRYLNQLAQAVPNIAQLVQDLAEAVPSEASVERLFSKMNLSVNDLQNCMSPEVVQARLQVSSAASIFLADYADGDAVVVEPSTKSTRSEQSSVGQSLATQTSSEPSTAPAPASSTTQRSASPTPPTPSESTGSIKIAKTKEAPFTLQKTVDFHAVLSVAYDFYVVQSKPVPGGPNASAAAADEPSAPHAGRRTRQFCTWCDKTLNDPSHQGCKLFVVCGSCKKNRSSMLHFTAAYQRLRKLDVAKPNTGGFSEYVSGSRSTASNTPIEVAFTCRECDEAAAVAAVAAAATAPATRATFSDSEVLNM